MIGFVSVIVLLVVFGYYRRKAEQRALASWRRHVERAEWSQGIDQSRSTWPWPSQDR